MQSQLQSQLMRGAMHGAAAGRPRLAWPGGCRACRASLEAGWQQQLARTRPAVMRQVAVLGPLGVGLVLLAAAGSAHGAWMSGREVEVAVEPPAWDPKGYVMAFACQGRFGNQFDYLLGTLDYAKKVDRTLVLVRAHLLSCSLAPSSSVWLRALPALPVGQLPAPPA